ncbi:OsmC family protein [Herbaspirillum sp. alder98]|uniref:OsmC family protein n=1 Tax=Herbaspirillum sp. alder98 TaxID=2913096 RepID=UPI001CD88E67|nr:OsmC family protein [Herbaspirillum sp. alder98]MCA1325764.1 OsmC family protein [Herbaspirillum sp. alder98]
MAKGEHKYQVSVEWTGNQGSGTSGYRQYTRDHLIRAGSKPAIPGSADPAFLGDPTRWNPEDLLVAAASACHKLWYLHLCADAGIRVMTYVDDARGVMLESPDGGRFTEIVLHPHVTIRSGDDQALALQLHHAAHAQCYIANSFNFPVRCEATIATAEA